MMSFSFKKHLIGKKGSQTDIYKNILTLAQPTATHNSSHLNKDTKQLFKKAVRPHASTLSG